MANWQGAVLTNAGLALQSKVEAGLSKLNLTKLKLGDGVPAELETMTDLAHPVQEVGINSVTDNEDGTVVVNGLVTNEGLTEGYYLREYGLFAKDDSGNEVLYCVSIDSNPDYLQPEGSATVISEEIGLTIAIGNAAVLNVTISPTGMATMVDLDNHSRSAIAHENRFSQYLPLEGGAMTGNITRNVDNGSFGIFGGSAADAVHGSYLTLFGKNHPNAGAFSLIAYDGGTKDGCLVGKADGTLTWGTSTRPKAIKSMAFPSATKVAMTTAAGTYTAPANGYAVVGVKGAAIGGYAFLTCNDVYSSILFPRISGDILYISCPVLANNSYGVSTYSAEITGHWFVYTEGEV